MKEGVVMWKIVWKWLLDIQWWQAILVGITAGSVVILTGVWLIPKMWPPSIFGWGALAIMVAATGSLVLQGLRKIPADPPHKAVVTILGQRTEEVKDEGWRLFLIYPYWHGFILVNVTKVNYDLPPQIVRTPDMAAIEIPISITWTPINENVCKRLNEKGILENTTERGLLINYLNAGGENGVKQIIDDVVRERLREWAMSKIEGPRTWEDALASREEAVDVLLKSILGENLEHIHADVPTPILLKFYDSRQKKFVVKRSQNEEQDKIDWELLDEWQKKLSGEEKTRLADEVGARKKTIARMRQGNGGKCLPQLGIRLDRLNIDEVKPTGKLAEAAEKMVTEQREMKGDEIRIRNISARIKELQKLGFGAEQALEVIQTEKGKVTKNIDEKKLNLSEETRKMAEKIIPQVSGAIVEGLVKIFSKEKKEE